MKLKKFLTPFLLFSILCFTFIPRTYAYTSHVDITGIPQTDRIFIGKYTNTSNDYSEIGSTFSSFAGTAGLYYHTTSGFNLDSLGVSLAFIVDVNIARNYIYSLNAIVCANSPYYIGDSAVSVYTANGQYQATKKQNMVYSNTVLTNLENTLYYQDNGYSYSLTSGACYNISSTFTPSVDGNWVNIAISNGANRSVSELRFMGYRIEGIGLYDGTVQSILNAQSNQISGLQTQIQQVQTTVDNTNKEIGDINDTLNDTSLNTGDLENSAGWLPPGPVDSILNLPLSLYQNLLNTLQTGTRACPALNINLPYVDEVLTVPCLSDIFSRIEGLNVFWTWVGTIAGAFILFNYLINLYKWVDATLTMRENNHFGGY